MTKIKKILDSYIGIKPTKPVVATKLPADDLGIVDVCLHMSYGQTLKVHFRGERHPVRDGIITARSKAEAYIFKSGQQGFFLVGDKYHNAQEIRSITLESHQWLG